MYYYQLSNRLLCGIHYFICPLLNRLNLFFLMVKSLQTSTKCFRFHIMKKLLYVSFIALLVCPIARVGNELGYDLV